MVVATTRSVAEVSYHYEVQDDDGIQSAHFPDQVQVVPEGAPPGTHTEGELPRPTIAIR